MLVEIIKKYYIELLRNGSPENLRTDKIFKQAWIARIKTVLYGNNYRGRFLHVCFTRLRLNKIMKLWLDDKRKMPSGFDLWARSKDEAIEILRSRPVEMISFDHDLGEPENENNGYEVAKWIEEAAFNNQIPRMEWTVHSDNPVGVARIIMAMKNADKYWDMQERY